MEKSDNNGKVAIVVAKTILDILPNEKQQRAIGYIEGLAVTESSSKCKKEVIV